MKKYNKKVLNAYNKTEENFNFAESFLQNYFNDASIKLKERAAYLTLTEIEMIFKHCITRYNEINKINLIASFQDHDFYFEYEAHITKEI